MFETIATVVIILGAAAWLFFWARKTASGEGGCSCGKCAKSCPSRKPETAEAGKMAE